MEEEKMETEEYFCWNCCTPMKKPIVEPSFCSEECKDVFEYSVFGSPNQKIGNFTGQKKLGDFSC